MKLVWYELKVYGEGETRSFGTVEELLSYLCENPKPNGFRIRKKELKSFDYDEDLLGVALGC